ncbi:MAG: tetratricopeptide repeat protein, partial [Rhodoferax sp.]|nr:tetratricopeptide repeat protein [Rhodoferax sp.]
MHAVAHFNLGVIQNILGNSDQAVQSYRRSLQIQPHNELAENNLGALLHASRNYSEAIDCFRRALQRAPEFALAWTNLGIALQASKKVDEAQQCLVRAISLDPQSFSAHSNLALSLREQGRIDESLVSSRAAIAIRASLAEKIRAATLTPVVAASREEIQHWRERFASEMSALLDESGTIQDPMTEIGVCNFNLAYQPECNRTLQELAARLYWKHCPALHYQASHCSQARRENPQRLKIGFISRFMYRHSIGRTTRGLLANMSRDRFEVTAIFVAPWVDDEISRFIQASADQSLVLSTSLDQARQEIAALELDVLFYQDVGMDAFTYYLAFSRLAPVQCVSFGHPDTTGIPNMDYWVSCENFETAQAPAHYSEKLFLLRNIGTLAYYYRPAIRSTPKDRSSFGLSVQKHIYLCPQSLFKIHPDFDAVFDGILRGDGEAEIVLVEAQSVAWTERLRARLLSSLQDNAQRVRFVPGMSPE